MSIIITKADVKRKCRISGTDVTYDSEIDILISDMQPGIEYTIADVYLDDVGNTRLQGVLKLGMTEIISGEFLRQLAREAGTGEGFTIGGITIGTAPDRGGELIEQGNIRLQPFRKAIDGMTGEAAVQSTSSYRETQFSLVNSEAW